MSIVITGSPGVGKHTITQEIAEKLRLPVIDINSVAKDAGLFEKNGDTNEVDTSKLGKILEQETLEKCVIVGHLAPYVLDKNKIKIMIVLRRSPYDLIPIYEKRGYTDKKITENTGSEILGIIAHDSSSKFQEKVFQVNTSEKSIPEAVEKVMTVISTHKGGEEVDWLDLVTKNSDLKKFFAD